MLRYPLTGCIKSYEQAGRSARAPVEDRSGLATLAAVVVIFVRLLTYPLEPTGLTVFKPVGASSWIRIIEARARA